MQQRQPLQFNTYMKISKYSLLYILGGFAENQSEQFINGHYKIFTSADIALIHRHVRRYGWTYTGRMPPGSAKELARLLNRTRNATSAMVMKMKRRGEFESLRNYKKPE